MIKSIVDFDTNKNPYVDIAGYAILRSKQIEEEKKEKEIKIWR